jgi:hypothetical protein
MADPGSSATISGGGQTRTIAGVLYLSATIMVVAGIVLGFVIGPALFALVAAGLIDGVLAYLFSSGRFGADGSPAAVVAASESDADPTDNPYARGD